MPPIETPNVLGVDDFAWRKGQRYGTILVDLATHRPIDLLPDHSVDTFAAWLEAHPGVEMISRDRALCYADGATRGAPQAQHVADRFHLLQNLREMTERLLDREMTTIRAAETTAAGTVEVQAAPPLAQAVQRPQMTRRAQEADVRSSRRQERFARVQELHAQGVGMHGIVRELDVSRNTVRTYLRTTECLPRAARPRRPNVLAPFVSYLINRWEAGCTNRAQRYREIKTQGFAGGESIVRDWATPRRLPRAGAPQTGKPRPASARSIAWLLLRPESTLNAEDQTRVTAFRAHSDVIDLAYPRIQAFGTMVRERQADQLEPCCLQQHKVGNPI